MIEIAIDNLPLKTSRFGKIYFSVVWKLKQNRANTTNQYFSNCSIKREANTTLISKLEKHITQRNYIPIPDDT